MSIISRTRKFWVVLILLTIGLGCSSTAGAGKRGDPKIRTIASIGDRPVGVVAGTPTSSAVAALDTPEPRRTKAGLVSGRVVDEAGRPVARAKVRLADGASTRGQVNQATTDQSGGFTLHDLRPGSRYTLIAEYDGVDGPIVGRSEVRAPETGVEIAVLAESLPHDRLRAEAPANSRRISERRPVDDLEAVPRSRTINREDIPPPRDVEDIDDLAASADLAPVGPVPVSRALSYRGATTPSGWQKKGQPGKPVGIRSSAVDDQMLAPDEPRLPRVGDRQRLELTPLPRTDASSAEPRLDEEDVNPLPLAIDPGEKPAHHDRAVLESRDPGDEPPGPNPRSARSNNPRPGILPGAFALAKDSPATDPKPRLVVPEVIVEQLPPISDAVVKALPIIEAPSEAAVVTSSGPVERPSTPPPPPAQAGSTTWGDIDGAWTAISADPAAATGDASKGPRNHSLDARLAIEASREPRPSQTLASGEESLDAVIETCKYDPVSRRLDDFRLADLQGQAVTRADFDADLILIDFWGTWCKPCIGSIPHLVELQKLHGVKRLSIIGIACEEGSPVESSKHVADAVERLGVNYATLVSRKDGDSPLRDSLGIRSYPTTVLINRRGDVLWKEEGAGVLTMARLDRMIAQNLRTPADSGADRVATAAKPARRGLTRAR